MASDTPAPHLLTIPRELRNCIYTYLYQDVMLPWDWRKGQESPKNHILNQICVRFHNAPYSNVMCAHSRLYDEYIKAVPIKNLSATIEVYPSIYANVNPNNNADFGALAERVTSAFKKLRKITIVLTYIDALSKSYVPGAEMWASIERLVGVIKSKAPRLSTIRVAFRHNSGPELTGPEQQYGAFATADFLPGPPTSLVDFPLVQRAEGYHVLCQKRGSSTRNTVNKFGAYVFSFELSKSGYFTPKDIVERWNLRGVHYRHVEPAWREKRGEEDAKTWF